MKTALPTNIHVADTQPKRRNVVAFSFFGGVGSVLGISGNYFIDDLALLDVVMPGIDRDRILETIRLAWEDVGDEIELVLHISEEEEASA